VPAAAAHAPARARPAQGASRVNPRTDPPPRSTTRLFLAYPRWATARAQERRVGARPVVMRVEFATEDLEQLLKLFGRLEP